LGQDPPLSPLRLSVLDAVYVPIPRCFFFFLFFFFSFTLDTAADQIARSSCSFPLCVYCFFFFCPPSPAKFLYLSTLLSALLIFFSLPFPPFPLTYLPVLIFPSPCLSLNLFLSTPPLKPYIVPAAPAQSRVAFPAEFVAFSFYGSPFIADEIFQAMKNSPPSFLPKTFFLARSLPTHFSQVSGTFFRRFAPFKLFHAHKGHGFPPVFFFFFPFFAWPRFPFQFSWARISGFWSILFSPLPLLPPLRSTSAVCFPPTFPPFFPYRS